VIHWPGCSAKPEETVLKKCVALAVLLILAMFYWWRSSDPWSSDPNPPSVFKANAEIKSLSGAVTAYMLKNNRELPDSLEAVAPYMPQKKIPKDPWNNPYVYIKDGSRDFKIVSYGRDGAPGGSGYDADFSSKD
jgi:hypothetical protein